MNDWQPISSAPKDGTRIRVGHELDRGSMKPDGLFKTTAAWDGERWALSAFFVIPGGGPYGQICRDPTHWLPEGEEA